MKIGEDICVIIPTYNNEKTLARVIDGVLEYVDQSQLILVNDGSTDSTSEIIHSFNLSSDHILVNEPNKGKGYSLRKAFKLALELGFESAITIDSDGQHFPEDLVKFEEMNRKHPGAVIMGSRNLSEAGAPSKSSFGNKFSNFWFKVETGITLPDTQTGYRLYPLKPLQKVKLITSRFETEIEVIVKLAWRYVEFYPVAINVKYDMDERVSHFRPFKDFFRISVLNSYLCLLAWTFYLPRLILHRVKKKGIRKSLKEVLFDPTESRQTKALSIGFGFFMGIVPIWGFQLLVGIPLAILFKMNKVLFIAAANISIPPMIPIIVFVSYWFGSFFVEEPFEISRIFDLSLESITLNLKQYIIGSVLFALISFVIGYFATLLLIKRNTTS